MILCHLGGWSSFWSLSKDICSLLLAKPVRSSLTFLKVRGQERPKGFFDSSCHGTMFFLGTATIACIWLSEECNDTMRSYIHLALAYISEA